MKPLENDETKALELFLQIAKLARERGVQPGQRFVVQIKFRDRAEPETFGIYFPTSWLTNQQN